MERVAAASLKPLRDGATEAVLDSQLFQSLLADALDSEQVQISLRKALETEGAEHVVETLFESGLVDEFVDRLVADGAAWVLINAVLARATAARADPLSCSALSITKSWIIPPYRTFVTGTFARWSLAANASPSSRSTSASPLMISASGSPSSCSTDARSGDAVICARSFSSVVN